MTSELLDLFFWMNIKTFSQIESIESAIESNEVKLRNKKEDAKYTLL